MLDTRPDMRQRALFVTSNTAVTQGRVVTSRGKICFPWHLALIYNAIHRIERIRSFPVGYTSELSTDRVVDMRRAYFNASEVRYTFFKVLKNDRIPNRQLVNGNQYVQIPFIGSFVKSTSS